MRHSMQGNNPLQGRHALITGGGTGIGAATARQLAGAGATVTVLGRREEPLQAVVGEGSAGGWVQCDITNPAAVKAAFELARTARGPVAVLIVNAGIADSAPFHRLSREAWDRMLAVNLTGAFDCVQAALPDLLAAQDARVVFVASVAGLRGVPYAAHYAASKHGVLGLMRSMAAEYAKSSMTVNAVCPGYVDSPMTDQSVERVSEATGRSEGDARDAIAGMNASGRLVDPEAIANVIATLCLPRSRDINGAAITIDGGTSA
jgi:NAD(P)-dependent dehydrogenase (short-subunit alcohol dehydrogenase family)